jgi:transcriptional regulator with XRE-family HTH domain
MHYGLIKNGRNVLVQSKGYGSFIKHHRLASGYKTMRRFAEATGISAATISRIEAEIQKPEPDTLKVFAKYLHTTSLVELMVICGYWDDEELLEPIDMNKTSKPITQNVQINESSVTYTVAKDVSEISIEELENRTLTYKGHVLTEEQKRHLLQILRAAAEMVDPK